MAMEHPPFEDVFFIASLVFSVVILRMVPCLLKHLNGQSHVHENHFSTMESSNPDFLAKHSFFRKKRREHPRQTSAHRQGFTVPPKGLTEKISWILATPQEIGPNKRDYSPPSPPNKALLRHLFSGRGVALGGCH